MQRYLKIFLLIILIAPIACSSNLAPTNTPIEDNLGGSEAGNPPNTIELIGTVPSSTKSVALKKAGATTTTCLADTITATNQEATETSAAINDDCTFSLVLDNNNVYTISFFDSDTLVATMAFDDNNSRTPNSFLILDASELTIDLGLITFTGNEAFPANEPSKITDADGDGLNDFEDTNDDDDDMIDEYEIDCDQDGIIDDYDADTSSCVR